MSVADEVEAYVNLPGAQRAKVELALRAGEPWLQMVAMNYLQACVAHGRAARSAGRVRRAR